MEQRRPNCSDSTSDLVRIKKRLGPNVIRKRERERERERERGRERERVREREDGR